MTYWTQQGRGADKCAPAIAALLINAIIGYALIMGLRVAPLLRTMADDDPLTLFNLKPPMQERPKPVPPAEPRTMKREGGAKSARAVPKSDEPELSHAATPVISVPIPVSQPAAPPTGSGEPTGAGGDGGIGNGEGSGSGAGSGRATGDGGSFSQARQIGGRFRNSDFPDWLHGMGRLKVGVRYAIGPTGHVDKCEVIERSGYSEVDVMTCRVIMERYRFRPARDTEGYAVTEVREEDYRWRIR